MRLTKDTPEGDIISPEPSKTQSELAQNNAKASLDAKASGQTVLATEPTYIDLEFNRTCNFRCVFCFIHGVPEVLQKSHRQDRDLEFDEILKLTNNLHATLQIAGPIGGDLFTTKDVWKVLSETQSTVYSLDTNGYLMNEKIIKKLIATGKTINLKISVNAANEHDYKKMAGKNVSLARLTKNILFLNREILSTKAPISVTLSFVIFKSNLEQIPEMLLFAKNTQCRTVKFNHLAENFSEDHEAAILENKNFDYAGEKLNDPFNDINQRAESLANELGINYSIFTHSNFEDAKMYKDCSFPWRLIRVYKNGDYYVCYHHDKLGNIVDENISSMAELWNSENIVRLRQDILNNCVSRYCKNAKCSYVKKTEI